MNTSLTSSSAPTISRGILSSNKLLAASALLVAGFVSSSQAIVVSFSGVGQVDGDQQIVDFINANFSNVTTFNYGDYSNPANIPAGTDVLFVGRRVFSGAYGDATNAATFNALTIPVVAFTSYVARPDGNRWGWHSGAIGGGDVVGSETTVTAAGAAVFGAAGTADWWSPLTGGGTGFNTAGTGTIGGGDILATIGGNILVAQWDAGELSGSGVAFGGSRLLFNIPDNNNAGRAEIPNTLAGQAAFIAALDTFTPLTANAIPEPSSTALLMGAGALGFIGLRRRRNA